MSKLIDDDIPSKRKTGIKRKHEYNDGYKTQPYEPNSPVQQDEDIDDDRDEQYIYEEGEKPKKVAAWQIAHKSEFDKSYE